MVGDPPPSWTEGALPFVDEPRSTPEEIERMRQLTYGQKKSP